MFPGDDGYEELDQYYKDNPHISRSSGTTGMFNTKEEYDEFFKGFDERKKGYKKTNITSEEKGNLSWPVEGEIINTFGVKTGIDGTQTNHPSIEIKTKIGSNVQSVHGGVVEEIGFAPIYGAYVVINHGDYSTLYGNLNEDEIPVSKGTTINKGQKLGKVTKSRKDDDYGVFSFMMFKTEGSGKDTTITNINPEEWLTK